LKIAIDRPRGLPRPCNIRPKPLIDAAVGELVGYEGDSLHRTDLKRFALRPDPPGSLDRAIFQQAPEAFCDGLQISGGTQAALEQPQHGRGLVAQHALQDGLVPQ